MANARGGVDARTPEHRMHWFSRMLDAHDYDVLTATPWYLPTRTFFLCLPR